MLLFDGTEAIDAALGTADDGVVRGDRGRAEEKFFWQSAGFQQVIEIAVDAVNAGIDRVKPVGFQEPAPVIAQMIDAPVNTIYSWIARGKKQLKEALS